MSRRVLLLLVAAGILGTIFASFFPAASSHIPRDVAPPLGGGVWLQYILAGAIVVIPLELVRRRTRRRIDSWRIASFVIAALVVLNVGAAYSYFTRHDQGSFSLFFDVASMLTFPGFLSFGVCHFLSMRRVDEESEIEIEANLPPSRSGVALKPAVRPSVASVPRTPGRTEGPPDSSPVPLGPVAPERSAPGRRGTDDLDPEARAVADSVPPVPSEVLRSFTARQVEALRSDTLYRIYARENRLFFIRIGGQRIASPGLRRVLTRQLGIVGFLLGHFIEKSSERAVARETEEVDASDPRDLLHRHPKNYQLRREQVVRSEIVPPLFGHGENVAGWRLQLRPERKLTYQFESDRDLDLARTHLGEILGDRHSDRA